MTGKGIKYSIAKKIINVRDSFLTFGIHKEGEGRRSNIKIISSRREAIKELHEGDQVLVIPLSQLSDRHYQIFTLDGKNLGVYRRLKNSIPKWWAELHLVDAFITDIQEQKGGRYTLSIKLEEL